MSTVTDRLDAAAEQSLGSILVRENLISAAQLDAVFHFARQHNLDLRQALLRLKLIAADRLSALIQELGVKTVAQDAPEGRVAQVTESVVLSESSAMLLSGANPPPDLVQRERDIRNDLKEIAATAGPIDLVTEIFVRACESRATDIHFDAQENQYRVRYRIDGQLHDVLEMEFGLATAVVSRLKVMANLNIVERRHAQDGRITIRVREENRDLRIATFPTVQGEKVVVRIHEAMVDSYSFDKLGLEPKEADALDRLCSKPYGAVLVAGPVGAGKTTTLYTCMSRVNRPTRNLMTIEDPIEHRIPGVNQFQIDNKVELGFSEGLKAMLRQDPDVIMIGEIRDEETAHIGIRAAMTGVLVFSTLHAADAPSTIGNLYDFKIPGYLLSNTLLGVVSQRLIRKVCPYCRIEFEPDESTFSLLGVEPGEFPDAVFAKGRGCPACFKTGYLSRTGVFEIMEIGEVLRELIFQQISKDVLRKVAIDMGMQTLRQSAVDKVLRGVSTVEEIYRVVAMN
ncbi:MAG: GspE/PulE family protein [Isosphaeraceae bacterium]|nr:GspE/PulE family protein [Isosphaeraceae bacterium]